MAATGLAGLRRASELSRGSQVTIRNGTLMSSPIRPQPQPVVHTAADVTTPRLWEIKGKVWPGAPWNWHYRLQGPRPGQEPDETDRWLGTG